MQKITLTFPDPNSLWLFKDKSKTVNVAVAPRSNTMTGPFSSEEIDIAVKEFQAVQVPKTSASTNPSLQHTETRSARSPFRYRFSQILSLLHL
jgi:hypothetical protein